MGSVELGDQVSCGDVGLHFGESHVLPEGVDLCVSSYSLVQESASGLNPQKSINCERSLNVNHFYADFSDLLDFDVPRNAYGMHVDRAVSHSLLAAARYREGFVFSVSDKVPFSELVDDHFSQAYFSPFGFEVPEYLSVDDLKAVVGLSTEISHYNVLLSGVCSGDVIECLQTLVVIIEMVRGEEGSFAGELQSLRDLCEVSSALPDDEVWQKVLSLSFGGQSVLMVAVSFLTDKKEALLSEISDLVVKLQLVDPTPRVESADGDLPQDLVFDVKEVLFDDDVASLALYDELVGHNEGRLVFEWDVLPLTRAIPQRTSFVSVGDDAPDILRGVRKDLLEVSQQVLALRSAGCYPHWSKLVVDYPQSVAEQTQAYHEAKDTLSNPLTKLATRQTVLQALDAAWQQMHEDTTTQYLLEVNFIYSYQWLSFVEEFSAEDDAVGPDQLPEITLAYLLGRLDYEKFQAAVAREYEDFSGRDKQATDEMWRCRAERLLHLLESHQVAVLSVAQETVPDFCGVYRDALRFYQAMTADAEMPVFERVDDAIRGVDRVLDVATRHLETPQSYPQALMAWPEWRRVKDDLPLRSTQGFLTGAIDAREFSSGLSDELEQVKHSDAIKVYSRDYLYVYDELETSAAFALKPWQANRFVNRFRFVIYSLECICHEIRSQEQAQAMSLQEYAESALVSSLQRFHLGYPQPDGSSPVAVSLGVLADRDFDPDRAVYKSPAELAELLVSSGRSESTVYERFGEFAAFFREYLPYFCPTYQVLDETDYTVGVLRDVEALKDVLHALEELQKEISRRIFRQGNIQDKQELEDSLLVCALAHTEITAYSQGLFETPYWNTLVGSGSVVTEHRVDTGKHEFFTDDSKDSKTEVLASIRGFADDPLLSLSHRAKTFRLSGMTLEQTSRSRLVLVESVLQRLPEPDPINDLTQRGWKAGDLYLLGRLSERLSHPFGQKEEERYDDLKQMVFGASLDDLEAFANQELSFGLTPAERLWASGFVVQKLAAHGRHNNGGGAAIYTETRRQEQVDAFVFSLNDQEAAHMASRLCAKFDLPQDFDWAGIDDEAVEVVLQVVDAYYADPRVTQERLDYVEYCAQIEPNHPNYVFDEDQALYALAYVSSDLYGTFGQEELLCLSEELTAGSHDFSPQVVEEFFASKTDEQKALFYALNVKNYHSYYAHYGFGVLQVSPESNVALPYFYRALFEAVREASAYVHEGQVDRKTLKGLLDESLLCEALDGEVLTQNQQQVLDDTLAEVLSKLHQLSADGEFSDEVAVVSEVRDILLGLHNRADVQEVERYSRYNPNYFSAAETRYVHVYSYDYFYNQVLLPSNSDVVCNLDERDSVTKVLRGISAYVAIENYLPSENFDFRNVVADYYFDDPKGIQVVLGVFSEFSEHVLADAQKKDQGLELKLAEVRERLQIALEA